MDANDVDLMEYQRLRTEIDSRTTISATILLGNLTVLGTGLTLLGVAPCRLYILIALSYVPSLLWLSWQAHLHQIYKLSGYIALELAPRLPPRDEPARPALYWEGYSRLVDRIGRKAYLLSPRVKCAEYAAEKFQLWKRISWLMALVFAVPPPVLIVAYFHAAHPKRAVLFGIGSALLFGIAVCSYWKLLKIQMAIDTAVITKICEFKGRIPKHKFE